MELKQIHRVAVGEFGGEPGFGARLVRAIADSDRLELVDDAAAADAVLEAWGEYADEGFAAGLTLSDHDGNELWSDRALRAHGSSGPMAYEQLLARLFSALDGGR